MKKMKKTRNLPVSSIQHSTQTDADMRILTDLAILQNPA
jgi:hypothetical protein